MFWKGSEEEKLFSARMRVNIQLHFIAYSQLLSCSISLSPSIPLCFEIEAVEQNKDTFLGHSGLCHCCSLHGTLWSLLVRELYVPVCWVFFAAVVASAQDLWSLTDCSTFVTSEKGPIQCEKWHLNPERKNSVECITRELCPATNCINWYSSCTPQTT